MRHLNVITWARWTVQDAYDDRYYTVFTCSILKPSYEYPVASVAMSITNAKGRVFIRYASLEALKTTFVIPQEYHQRLHDGYAQASTLAADIRRHQRTLYKLQDLSPDTQIIRTDTGEIINDVERFLQDQ